MTRLHWMAGFTATLALVLVACGESETPKPAGQEPAKVATEVEKPAPAEKPAAAETPAPAAAVTPTAATGPHDPAKGEVLYVQSCSNCHGVRGAGDGPVGKALTPTPARHDDGEYMNPLSNAHLFKVIKEGGTAVGKSPLMAPWGGALSDEQIWHVVAFVRSLAEPPYTGPKP